MHAEYLIFNLIIFLAPIVGFSFYKKAFFPKLKNALVALSIVATVFVVWDSFVTGWWWDFNAQYILGLKIGSLPIEEVLFFFTVPWSCLVFWVNLKQKVSGSWKHNVERIFLGIFFIVGGLAAMSQMWYTLAMCIGVSVFLYLSMKNGFWLRQKSVVVFLSLTTLLTLLFNGYLTSRPIVTYHREVISSFRIMSIPVEDFMYGWLLIGSVVVIYERISKK